MYLPTGHNKASVRHNICVYIYSESLENILKWTERELCSL